jgi:hypothetical protein
MKKLKILMCDMILHFKFIYNPKNTYVTIQTIHLIVFSPNCKSMVYQNKIYKL